MIRARRSPLGASWTLLRRAYRWAVQDGVPVYAHIRGLWLLARALRIQAEDRAPRGGSDGFGLGPAGRSLSASVRPDGRLGGDGCSRGRRTERAGEEEVIAQLLLEEAPVAGCKRGIGVANDLLAVGENRASLVPRTPPPSRDEEHCAAGLVPVDAKAEAT